jgi:hypothetical protein
VQAELENAELGITYHTLSDVSGDEGRLASPAGAIVTPGEQEQYRALRATIRERGTARVCIFAGGVAVWAALAVTIGALSAPPVATLVPLLLLAATFEGVYALHVGVERVGRYLDVAFDDGWERAAAAFGRPPRAATIDPLFVVVFTIAALLNLGPAIVAAPTMQELVFVGGAHALFVVRLIFARATAAKQREIDRERFRALAAERR